MDKTAIIESLNQWRGERIHRTAANCQGSTSGGYNSLILIEVTEEGLLVKLSRFSDANTPFLLEADKWLDDKWELAADAGEDEVDYI